MTTIVEITLIVSQTYWICWKVRFEPDCLQKARN